MSIEKLQTLIDIVQHGNPKTKRHQKAMAALIEWCTAEAVAGMLAETVANGGGYLPPWAAVWLLTKQQHNQDIHDRKAAKLADYNRATRAHVRPGVQRALDLCGLHDKSPAEVTNALYDLVNRQGYRAFGLDAYPSDPVVRQEVKKRIAEQR
ncbi:hypothetical protein [Pseudogulbenkiania sp. MAI-1]|uniref:hypothetical protein n=1 Tax=Pseudogulbenkiania sp. MAI-1 TaxID=990370 RepID=UPI00045E98AB|nr:hypothetical protein [Pseudogulbenkiania sp. MAI-1]